MTEQPSWTSHLCPLHMGYLSLRGEFHPHSLSWFCVGLWDKHCSLNADYLSNLFYWKSFTMSQRKIRWNNQGLGGKRCSLRAIQDWSLKQGTAAVTPWEQHKEDWHPHWILRGFTQKQAQVWTHEENAVLKQAGWAYRLSNTLNFRTAIP